MDATAAYPPQQTRSNLAGIGWMLVTGLFFVAVNGTVRWIGDDLPAAQSAFLRFVFGLLFLAVPLARALRTGFPAPVWRRFVLRGAIHVCAVVLWFYAMARIPVAEVTAIGFINPTVRTTLLPFTSPSSNFPRRSTRARSSMRSTTSRTARTLDAARLVSPPSLAGTPSPALAPPTSRNCLLSGSCFLECIPTSCDLLPSRSRLLPIYKQRNLETSFNSLLVICVTCSEVQLRVVCMGKL